MGADRPGYTTDLVDDWCTFMLERDIRRVVCLLSHERLTKYVDLLESYRQRFVAVTHAPIDNQGLPSEEALDQVLAALLEAERANERVVAHCAAGMGRTGLISSA